MPFDPNFPIADELAFADEMRAQLNALNDQDTATNQRIDNLPPAFPHTGDAEISGHIKGGGSAYIQGELGFAMNDIGGSGESGFKIVAANNGDGPIPRFITRNSGMDQSNFGIDGTGITGNLGNPTV